MAKYLLYQIHFQNGISIKQWFDLDVRKDYLINIYCISSCQKIQLGNIQEKQKATAGQFNLTLEICREIEIPLPTISKQINTINELESKLTVCDKIEETLSQSLQQAETLRQSILKKAFEGKLV
ncbi:MAG: hypothetical protein IPG78_00710 [Ignavibacteria bacterium]|nr:hypothetical protein [Ignavibacteria bacterium]